MIVGSSRTSSQLEAGSIMVRAKKSIDEPSLPLRVYGPMRSTHRASQGTLSTILDGRCPYFSDRFLFIWQVLHDFDRSDGGTHSFPVYRGVGVYTVMVCRWTDHILSLNLKRKDLSRERQFSH